MYRGTMPDVEQPVHERLAGPQVGPPTGSAPDTSQELRVEPFDAKTAMDTLLEGLAEPTTSRHWRDELRHLPEANKDLWWQNCFRVVEKHDKDLCQAYREQIDTLLVFAGLFSAVVTAFAVESYQWLQDDPADASVVLLRDMVLLMAQASNRTVEPPPIKSSRLSDEAISRINVSWFVSLSLSLSAALVGILCKQWLREYERDAGMSPEKALAVRQIKFLGLEYWRVGTIVASVPIILQIALALFLLGILDLLWRLHTIVASCVTGVAGLTLAFYLLTTFLPVIQYVCACLRCCRVTDFPRRVDAFSVPLCAFKSAQAWIVIRIAQPAVEYCITTYARCFSCYSPPEIYPLDLPRPDSWVRFDINWTRRREYLHHGPHAAYEALSWAARHLDEADLSAWIWHCVWARRWGNLGVVDDTSDAAEDIGCVADAYPMLIRLGSEFPADVRALSLAFRCSLRAEIPADTIIELLLKVAFEAGVNSRWTQEALNAVVALYDERSVSLSDDVAMGLLDLAEHQSNEQWETDFQITTDARNPHFPFLQIARLLDRGSRFSLRLLPAMCALGVPWLGVQSRDLVKVMARDLLAITINLYVSVRYSDRGLHKASGVVLVARFASITSTIWPDFLTWWADRPDHQAVLLELLSIWSSRDENAAPGGEMASSDLDGLLRVGSPGLLGSNSRDDVRITVCESQSPMAEANLSAPVDPPEGLTATN